MRQLICELCNKQIASVQYENTRKINIKPKIEYLEEHEKCPSCKAEYCEKCWDFMSNCVSCGKRI